MEKYIIELSEIRGKLLHAIDTKDELYAMMQVNNIDNLLYAMNEENKALQASTDQSKLLLADVRKRTIIDKLKYFFICKNIGHKVSSVHRLYPSKYCSVCNKHRSQF